MLNSETGATRAYHNDTKHSQERLRQTAHYLDWDIKPSPFKVYPDLERIPLPRELPPLAMPALAAIAAVHRRCPPKVPELVDLARLLHLSAGITRRKSYPDGQEWYFRAAACTGAMYHIDVYVICGELSGLPAGVYHFGPHDFSLYRLRDGDHRGVAIAASGGEPSLRQAPVILAFASTYWRNAWKYRARAYRHCYWDCGTLLANLFAVAAAGALPTNLVCGFVDETIETLLGLNPEREGALALVAIGASEASIPDPPADVPLLALATLPLSSDEVAYPAIQRMHAASSLGTPDEVRRWRGGAGDPMETTTDGARAAPLDRLPEASIPTEPLDRVILRRGSTRQFASVPIQFDQLSRLLEGATGSVPADYGASRSDLYLIINAVDGLTPGTYVWLADEGSLQLLRAGSFRGEAGYLDLGQDLAADASINAYLLVDLESVLARFGNRGYRVAQLDAAIIGGLMYLGAYAMRLGATGLTFFDDDVIKFFSPHAHGKEVMFLLAVGRGKRSLPSSAD